MTPPRPAPLPCVCVNAFEPVSISDRDREGVKALAIGEGEAGLSVDEESGRLCVAVLGRQVQRGRLLLVHRVDRRSGLELKQTTFLFES